jgi:hypothetical protein
MSDFFANQLEAMLQELPRPLVELRPTLEKLAELGRKGVNYAYPHLLTLTEELEKAKMKMAPYHPYEVYP